MTNISNECGLVLNCVLTTGEGAGLEDLCQGIVKRYQDAGVDLVFVDGIKTVAEVEAVVIENNVTAHVLRLVKITDKALPFDELMTA